MLVEPESLLEHKDFVKTLARQLVLDDQSADDVTQQTWLAALEHPPRTSISIRNWLAKIARNIAFTTRRAERSRIQRERATARSEGIPSAAESYERAVLRRRVIDEVLTLEEPYRYIVLLRFYEELAPREIASHLNIPVETVRTRLKRGLAKLRQKLDKEFGDRSSWCLALAPLAGLKVGVKAATAGVTASTVSTVSGGLIMATKVKIGIAAAVIIAVAVSSALIVNLMPTHESDAPLSEPGDAIPPIESIVNGGEVLDSISEGSGERFCRENVAPTSATISGQVVDSETGKPVTAFDLMLWESERAREPGKMTIHKTIRDTYGRFLESVPNLGSYTLLFRSSRHCFQKVLVEVSESDKRPDILVKMEPGFSVSGVVVEHDTDRPVADALVCSQHTNIAALLEMGYPEMNPHVRTGLDGSFTLRGLRTKTKQAIVVLHHEFAVGFIELVPGACDDRVIIRLRAGFEVYGRVLDDNNQPVERVLIEMAGTDLPLRLTTLTSQDGRYRTFPIAPELVSLRASSLRGEPMKFAEETRLAEVTDRNVEVNFGPSSDHITWRGTFNNDEGLPESDGTISLRPTSIENSRVASNFRRSVKTNTQGAFQLSKIQPGRYKIILSCSGHPILDWGEMAFDSPGIVKKDIDLSRSEVTGVVVDRTTRVPIINNGEMGTVRVYAEDRRTFKPYSSLIDEQGGFEIRTVPPGVYRLHVDLDGFCSEVVHGVVVSGDDEPESLRIPLTPACKLLLKVVGFGQEALFNIRIEREEDHDSPTNHSSMGESGDFQKVYDLAAGDWTVSVSFKDIGCFVHSITANPNTTTELIVHKDDLLYNDKDLTLHGRLIDAGGLPLVGAKLRFYSERFFSNLQKLAYFGDSTNSAASGVVRCVTDDGGRFVVEDFKRGRWDVRAILTEGNHIPFPAFVIPSDADDSFTLNLTLAGGAVFGTLLDSRNGSPLRQDGPKWWAFVADVKNKRSVSELQGSHTGSEFRLVGVPQGDFQLKINVRGYEDFCSEPFHLSEGQSLNLGDIRLSPCGVLDLEVVDAYGQPFTAYYQAFCNGQRLQQHLRERLSPGRHRYYSLPLGSVIVRVEAQGFLDKEFAVTLKPVEPVSARVVVHPQ